MMNRGKMPGIRSIESWMRSVLLFGSIGSCAIPCIHVLAQEGSPANSQGGGFRVQGVAKGRLSIPLLANPLKLETLNKVPIELHGFSARTAHVNLSYNGGYAARHPGIAHTDVRIVHLQDGSAYISIVPENLGKLHLQIGVDFDDGYIDSATLDTAEVVLPDRKPEKLYVDVGFRGTLYLDLTGKAKWSMVDAMALYAGALHPVPIPPEYLEFKVIAEDQKNPPISVDQSAGRITALNYGHALVQTTFEGISTLTCVSVQEDVSSGANRLDCSELVPPGMTLPKIGAEDFSQQFQQMRNKPRAQQHPNQ